MGHPDPKTQATRTWVWVLIHGVHPFHSFFLGFLPALPYNRTFIYFSQHQYYTDKKLLRVGQVPAVQLQSHPILPRRNTWFVTGTKCWSAVCSRRNSLWLWREMNLVFYVHYSVFLRKPDGYILRQKKDDKAKFCRNHGHHLHCNLLPSEPCHLLSRTSVGRWKSDGAWRIYERW